MRRSRVSIIGGRPVSSIATTAFISRNLRRVWKIVVGVCLLVVTIVYTVEIVATLAPRGSAANMPIWSIDQASQKTRREVLNLARPYGVETDTRNRIQLIDALRDRGIDAVPAVMVGDLLRPTQSVINVGEVLPIGGISNRFTILCSESGFVTYESDERGFRNPRGIWDSRHADLAVVGESFSQGYCVPDGKNFVDLLRPHYAVTLNLGTSGESSLLQLGAIKEYLPQYTPKIVLWIFCEGIDLRDLGDELHYPLMMRYLEPSFSQHLLDRQSELDAALRRYVADKLATERATTDVEPPPHSFIQDLPGILKLWHLRGQWDAYRKSRNSRPMEMVQFGERNLFADSLVQARDTIRGWGGTLYFVYLPSWDRYQNNRPASETERTTVLNLVSTLQVPIIDVHVAFQAQADPLSLFPLRRFGHYNEAGNRVVAEAVLNTLRASGHTAQSATAR